MQKFQNKKILILGLGVLGRGVNDAIFFAQQGAKVRVTDLKTAQQLAPSIKKLKKHKNIKYTLGKHLKKDILQADLIMRNADVPLSSPLLKLAFAKKIPVEMDESLFAKHCPCPIIGITGTRGKTTTAFLIAEVLKLTGRKVHLAGNIQGKATLPLIKKVTPFDLVVLELSSWQLQGFGWNKISPHVAVFTNVYEDHLNRYKNMRKYVADKKIIFKYQTRVDHLVLGKNNDYTRQMNKEPKSKTTWFSKTQVPKSWQPKMPGDHNLENIAAAIQVGKIFKLSLAKMKPVLCKFPGVEHRLEYVRAIKGIAFYNDTTSTTPISGQLALQAIKKPSVLICGGADKKLDLTEFAREIVHTAKAVVLLEGTATNDLQNKICKFGGADLIFGRFNNLKNAVEHARFLAKKGDAILLSPGCASFGMFKNEYDRGERFKKIVKNL